MNTLAIRITLGGLATHESILEYFKKYTKLVTSENEDTNHHYNLLVKTELKVDNFRNKMNRHFQFKVNQSYCRLDKGKYSIYMCKENKIIYNDMFTASELEKLVKDSYIKAPKSLSFTETIIANYPFKDYTKYFNMDEYIAEYVLTQFQGKLHDSYTIQKVGNAIACLYYPDIYIQKQKKNFTFFF